MKFTCSREDLAQAVSVTSRVVPQRHANSALEGILVHAGLSLQLSGFNLDTGITMEIPAEIRDIGRCVMPSPLFGEIVRKLPEGEDVTIEMDDKYKVTIVSGIVKFQIMAADAMDFPELPQVGETGGLELTQSQLSRLIEGTIFCISTELNKPVHMGCRVELEGASITMIGLDGFRIGVRRETLAAPAEPGAFVVAGTGLKEIRKLIRDCDSPVTIQHDDKRIVFHIDGAVVVCRLLDGSFLDWKKTIRRFDDFRLCVNSRAFEASVERVQLMTTDIVRNPVRCTFADGQVEMTTKTAIGNARDVCSYAGDGKNLEIGFNCRYLLEALRAVEDPECMLELQSGLQPMVIAPAEAGSEKFLYMVLPVRLSEWQG